MPAPELQTATLTKQDLDNEIAAMSEMLEADKGAISPEDKQAADELIEENRQRFIALNSKGGEVAIKSTVGLAVDLPEQQPEPFVDPGYAQANEDNWRSTK